MSPHNGSKMTGAWLETQPPRKGEILETIHSNWKPMSVEPHPVIQFVGVCSFCVYPTGTRQIGIPYSHNRAAQRSVHVCACSHKCMLSAHSGPGTVLGLEEIVITDGPASAILKGAQMPRATQHSLKYRQPVSQRGAVPCLKSHS